MLSSTSQELAREKSDEVKRLYERFGKQISVHPQFSQFTVKDDPTIQRVVHLTYRVGNRDLSYPRPQVNLTTREVETPAPDPEDEPEAGGVHRESRRPPVNVVAALPMAKRGLRMHMPPYRAAALAGTPDPRSGGAGRRAQRFFRPTLVDPPAQEATAEFLVSESGGQDPRKGTAWKVHFARGLHKGLYITGAWFKRDLGEDWIKILNDARIAELFVPYHRSGFIRYYDLTSFSFPLSEVKAEDAGPFGSLMPPFQGDPFRRS